MNEKQLAKLIKKNQQRAEAKAQKARTKPAFDPTLQRPPEDDDLERQRMFKEMKRREF